MPIPTPHITAASGDYAKTVLMPGDPLRAKFIAENYLQDAREVNNVRGMLGYTGTYKGKAVSVQGSGMGMPSMGIYSYELFNFYEVENIIRIGSAGGMKLDLNLGDIVLGLGVCTNSKYADNYLLPGNYAPIASYALVQKAQRSADALGIRLVVGNLLSTDTFYDDNENALKSWLKMGVLAVEMEAAALYMNAARANKNALCICTISDTIFTGKAMPADERRTSFTQMMELALGMV
ncbi:MAG: purine-nucleoside phosphorylase [Clostridiales bacterium]|jgi:purine-nucleoside phosphorylase|nr:purine-nucleoside phosphorylase [Clostridiales bacterium]